MMEPPCSESTECDERYSHEEEEAQYDEFYRSEKDKVLKEYWKPAAVEARDINIHANIINIYSANEYRSKAITKAENKVREAALQNDDLFVRSGNMSNLKKEVDRLVRIERTRLEELYPKRDVKYQYVYFSSEVIHFLIETILCGKTTREAYKLLQQHEGLNHTMDRIIKDYDYDIDVTEYIKIAQRRGSKYIKKVYDEFAEQYKDARKGEKYRERKFKQATTDATKINYQPKAMGELYDNIRLISAADLWGQDYKQLYTSSDSGIEGCLAKLARALKLARDSNDLKDSEKKNNCLTAQLETTKAALAALKDTPNEKLPNHIALIKSLCKDKEIKASKMLPILITAGCYSDKDIEDKQTKSKLLDNIRQIMSREKQPLKT